MTALCLALLTTTAASATEVVEFKHRGVTIAGKSAPPGAHYDIDIVSPEAGADRVRDALDVLYTSSPFSAKAVERLKQAGNVVIAYDPAFPGRELHKVTIAAFLPDFYQAKGETKDFVVVVGRFGAKWSARDLAPVLAHELTGHGMQHLRGHLDHVREVDLECEAYLYQEKAYQDLGYDKHSRQMIKFRQTLERHWCADFKEWQRKKRPQGLAYWEKLNPDVPKILDDYLVYIEDLRKSGVAVKAVAQARQAQLKKTQAQLAEMAASNDPETEYQLAQIFMRGIGIQADKEAGLRWLKKAAEGGVAHAQADLARAYIVGDGVTADMAEAARWSRAAAENGIAKAAYNYGAMLFNGDGVTRNQSEGRRWLERAAAQGSKRAREALKKLDGQRAN